MPAPTPPPGSDVYLGSVLTNVHLWGIISDLDTPTMMAGSFEILGKDGAIALDALVGPQGVPGENAPIVDMQWEDFDSPEDLPTNLTDDPVDVGKAWWIENMVYVWDGTGWRIRMMGVAGPAGPVPNIHPTVQLLNPDDDSLESTIEVSGTALNPGWLLKLKAPRGPKGNNATLRNATDYDNAVAPQIGEAIVWNGHKFQARSIGNIMPRFYTMPEANFTNFSGMTTRMQIGSIVIPPQQFDWVPYVTGHIRAVGIEADSDPLILGCEVRVGHPSTGQLIGRGFGNSSTWTTIVPHVSMPGAPNDAITPDNRVGVVPAYSTGAATTIYVNLFNDGITGVYSFNKRNAQLAIQCIPVSGIIGGGS
ncbi:phage tail protein [Mycobacterium sp. CBMA293]|uniref:phage tail protein n=1 Tax=unclassified Mycolicibacterium TaxID=2636767 RepID=UPI0012DBCC4B|nr:MULTISPECIES: phage tail protein [unclassified Mycolicibacterium]MUL44459.1 phage tail protein [Mycolicibacterium sp. CBMA 360]MUL59779.1 phage tail protein [Mycolicibacterium sp. CBMA 335]MUL68622.1 phage tail protein [Mycolicibacterium sp. CBMA 311]MUL93987.1 phage tail protein [Mycolicibacterium sp. CBMA 230]MUM06234.1 phage tail protein [Mycolicibacterium sp. CBMA 213]